MNRLFTAGLLVLLLRAPAGSRLPQTADVARAETGERPPAATIDDTLKSWPEPARRSAQLMLSKYGPPTRFDDSSLVWLHNGPWEKTVAYRDGWPQYKNPDEQDYLRQVIGYRVPEDKLEAIMAFDPRVEADPSTNELAARSGSERMNFLLLNLTDDIVTE